MSTAREVASGKSGSSPRFATLLWDIDGTLIDTTQLIVAALDHTYRTFLGRTLPTDEIRAIIGIPLAEQVRALGEPSDSGVSADSMTEEFIRYYESHREMERIVDGAIRALIEGKCQGNHTALVTSKNAEEIANTLPRLGILDYVDTIVCANDVANPKPDPESVFLALERVGSEVDEALFIGDTVHDMRAGKAAGVKRCAVTWGAGPFQLLLDEKPDYICDYPDDLMSILGL